MFLVPLTVPVVVVPVVTLGTFRVTTPRVTIPSTVPHTRRRTVPLTGRATFLPKKIGLPAPSYRQEKKLLVA